MMNASKLVEAIEQQASLYARLYELAERQHECVRQDRQDELLDVLEQRGRVVEQIAITERLLRPVRQRWADIAAKLDEDSRRRAESAFSGSRELLARITAADQDDVLVLQQRKLNIGRELRATHSQHRIATRYAASAYAAPSRTDIAQ